MSPRRDSPSFTAQYGGRCAADCGDLIKPGEEVRYVADELMHDECASEADGRIVAAHRAEPDVCSSCRTVHAGECM